MVWFGGSKFLSEEKKSKGKKKRKKEQERKRNRNRIGREEDKERERKRKRLETRACAKRMVEKLKKFAPTMQFSREFGNAARYCKATTIDYIGKTGWRLERPLIGRGSADES